MSMSRGCVVVEREPGKWYCAVASTEYDYDFEHYNVYGPASTMRAALDAMHARECNPGAFEEYTHDGLNDWVKNLIDEGIKRRAEERKLFRYRY